MNPNVEEGKSTDKICVAVENWNVTKAFKQTAKSSIRRAINIVIIGSDDNNLFRHFDQGSLLV